MATEQNFPANEPWGTPPEGLNLVKGGQPSGGTPPRQWGRVTVLGGEETTIDYTDGMLVKDALGLARVRLRRGDTVQVNGEPATLLTRLNPNSTIQVTSEVTNG